MKARLIVIVFLALSASTLWASEGAGLRPLTIPATDENRLAGVVAANTICRGCHDFKYLSYQSLLDVGLSADEVDELRGDEPLSATLASAMTAADRMEIFGRLPPDLSLMARAREGGVAYIYTLLTSFAQDAEGEVDNHLFPGIKMPDVLGYSATSDDPEARQELEQQAQQIALFLAWAADPHAEERQTLGVFVILYLILLAILLKLLKKRVWSRLDRQDG